MLSRAAGKGTSMGKKKDKDEPPPETEEEKAERKRAEADKAVGGGQIESMMDSQGCSCAGLTLASAIRESIAIGEHASFDVFAKDERSLARHGPERRSRPLALLRTSRGRREHHANAAKPSGNGWIGVATYFKRTA